MDDIKRERWISGKGHTETVRYLAQHYKEYENIEGLLKEYLGNLGNIIEGAILAALKRIITNLLQKPSS